MHHRRSLARSARGPAVGFALGMASQGLAGLAHGVWYFSPPAPTRLDVADNGQAAFSNMNMLDRTDCLPSPSMLIWIPCSLSTPVNSMLVNWLPWSVLKIFGAP